ncbi:MAG TPA: type IV pilus secretin PilQ [Polyangiaceae bacterium]|nr:type IV pilus secretin PilQ [Polyangiaceae bacterium]
MLLHSGAALAAGDDNHVRDLAARTLESTAGPGTELVLRGTKAPAFSVRVESAGKRLVVDVANADLSGAGEPITSPVGLVGGALTQTFKTSAGTMTRLTVNLLKPASYRVFADGNDLRVQLAPAAQTAPGAPSLFPAPAAPQAVATPELADVRFERRKVGKGQTDRVIIQASDVPSYQLSAGHDGRLRLTMKNVRVPASLARALELGAYGGPVRKVSTSFDAQTNSAVIELERAGDDQGVLSVEGKQIVWSFDAAPAVHAKGPARDTSKTVTVARERPVAEGPRVETSIRPVEPGHEGVDAEVSGGGEAGFTSTMNAQVGRYSGRRIDLDLKDADIHNILRLLADVGRVNIVTADDVSGSVTIRMRNVPWDQALDVVLQAKGLGMVRSGNLIRVAPLAALQKERELRLAAAKQEYELTPLETRLIPVSYARADEIQARAKDLLSPRGSIAVDERTNVLIARDISGGLDNIEQLVRALDTQTPQVLIEARIVEATSRYQRDIGIQWGGDATFSEATGNPTGIAFPSSVGVAGGNYDGQSPTQGLSPTQAVVDNPNYAVNLPAAVGTGQGGALGISLGSINNAFNLGVRLSAAEASGLLRIVSSPRILTLDNREARINQGTLIPFAQLSAQGVQTTFQEAKLQLLVRPHVTADGSVSMHVKINRDEPDFNQTSARGDPTILKREAETDLLVMDGHTAVIGGIYTRNTGRNLDQVPFFGDIPILGVLFQRRRASDTRNELVIFLTPRIVNRAEALGR